MTWLWMVLALVVLAAAARYRAQLRRMRPDGGGPVVDDEAVRRILRTGRLPAPPRPGGLDMRAAARAEEEFWAESWDEPEEYRP